MAKLFALEEMEVENQAVELEVSPEEGEVADVQVETEAEAAQVEDNSEAISEGVEAADQLEEVEEVVEKATEEEGLDPVAAEAIRIAVEAICARIGANSKAIYPLYAVENFQSASSRKANTKIALEGISEFLKNLWEKIKAALKKLWNKISEFWSKHFSSLNRMQKALESMKEKVNTAKGVPTSEEVKAPGSLLSIFPVVVGQYLDIDTINTFGKQVEEARTVLVNKFKIFENITTVGTIFDIERAVKEAKGGLKITFGSETSPLPGGHVYNWTFKLEEETEDKQKTYKLEVEENHSVVSASSDKIIVEIANKDKLKELIASTLTNVKAAIKYRDKYEQRQKKINGTFKAIDKSIGTMSKEVARVARANLRAFNLVMSKGPVVEAKYVSAFTAQVKGVLQFTNVCLKNFKNA